VPAPTSSPGPYDPVPGPARRDDSDPYGWRSVAPAEAAPPPPGGPAPRGRGARSGRAGGGRAGGGRGEGRGGGRGDGGPGDPARPVPVRRLLSAAVAGFAALLAAGLILGSQTARVPYAVVVLAVQALFLVAWTIGTLPPAPRVVAGVGLATAAVADLGAVWPTPATLAPLALAMVAGVVLGIVGQLSRRTGRVRVTESFSTSLVVVLGVVSYASLIVLTRRQGGTQAIVACLAAAGVALVVARTCDVFWSRPRIAAAVPRGAGGVVLGAMVGTAVAAVVGSVEVGLTPRTAALAGLATAVAAAMADLAVGYAEAGRHLTGSAPTLWPARHTQGPLVAFALAAPVAYLMSVLVLLPGPR
jgi:hypothetical protein